MYKQIVAVATTVIVSLMLARVLTLFPRVNTFIVAVPVFLVLYVIVRKKSLSFFGITMPAIKPLDIFFERNEIEVDAAFSDSDSDTIDN